MSKQTALEEMGVNNPEEIIRYTLRQEGIEDVLKIYYRRQKGSLLPVSRKYKFGRADKTVMVDSGKRVSKEIYDISPFLQRAVAELDQIVKQHEEEISSKKRIIHEMAHLEKTFSAKMAELRQQLEKL